MKATEFQNEIEIELRNAVNDYENKRISFEDCQQKFMEVEQWATQLINEKFTSRKLKTALTAFQMARANAIQNVPFPVAAEEDARRLGLIE